MKKIIALLLVGVITIALVGCGSSGREVVQLTLSTEDAAAILAAAGIKLPDASETAAAGTVVKWFSWYDDLQNYSDDEIINSGYWTFQEKYDCSVKWVECTWGTRFDELATLILSSESPDFYPGHDDIFPSKCLKGMFVPVDDYIDYDDPLWAGERDYAYNYYSIQGRPYVIVYDNTYDNIVVYNRRVMNELGYEDPAELFYNDEWTWDVFYEMCVDFTDPDEDMYALDGWYYSLALMHSCGESIVTYNTETQQFESNIDSPAIERAASLLYDLSKNSCLYPVWDHDWSTREGNGIKQGLCLFYFGYSTIIWGTVDVISTNWGDVTEGEVMFVPLPRDDDGDGNYYTESIPTGYAIIQGAKNPEGVALLAACMRFKVVDPTVVSLDRRQLEETYLWTEEMLDMYDTCYALSTASNVIVTYGEGYGDKLYTVTDALERFAVQSDASTWASLKEAYGEQVEYWVAKLNEDIASYDPYSASGYVGG